MRKAPRRHRDRGRSGQRAAGGGPHRGRLPRRRHPGRGRERVRGTSGRRWIVDPLDGTTNFAHGYPLFNVSIGYERDGQVVAGRSMRPRSANATRPSAARARPATAARCGFRRRPPRRRAGLHGLPSRRVRAQHPQFAALSGVPQGVRRDGAAALDLASLPRAGSTRFGSSISRRGTSPPAG